MMINADNQGKPPGLASRHSRNGIFNNHSPRRLDIEYPGSFKEGIWCRLAGQAMIGRNMTVNNTIEERTDACGI